MSFPWLLMIVLVTVNLLNNPYHLYIYISECPAISG